MAVGKPITPIQAARMWKLYLQSANYCEVARSMGMAESTVRTFLKKKMAERAICREVHGLAMEQVEMDNVRRMFALGDKTDAELKTASGPDALKTLAGIIHDSAKVTSTLRLNNAKLNGTLVERREMSGSVSLEGLPDGDLDRRIAELEEAARRGK